MMNRLLDSASRGNVEELHLLLRENPLILHYMAVESDENPLELACLCGHLDLARELLILKPKFARKLNPKGYSPLHLAAANGHVEIVQELTSFDPGLCRLRGKDMRTALHSATLRGETSVINEMLSACPECIQDVTIMGETCLHLAVRSGQYESLQILVDWISKMGKQEMIINVHDEQKNTVLSLAMEMNERRALQLLLPIVNEETQTRIVQGCEYLARSSHASTHRTSSYDYFKFQKGRDSPSDARTALLVIAVLVATATFQVGLSPPGGTWQDNNSMTNNSSESSSTPIAGTSIMGSYNGVAFIFMVAFNSIGFSVSISMIGMLTSRFPLRGELLVCLITLHATYGIAVNSMSPDGVSAICIALTSVLPTLVHLVIYLLRKYVGQKMVPMGQSLVKYKVVRALADYYG